MTEKRHIPVLLKEVIERLRPMPNQDFIDGTVGLGGHAQVILNATAPYGRLLAIDRDASNLDEAKQRLSAYAGRVTYVHGSYGDLKSAAYAHGFHEVHGILLDLGFSSPQIEDPTRGFSFRSKGPLDMRYDTGQELTAATIINSWKKEELEQLFQTFGEERHAHKIADRIVATRRREKILTTDDLARIIESAVPHRAKALRIHPATRVFQALRIAVNDELHELERALPETLDVLTAGGRLAVISFHSLEDRIVKRFMKAHAHDVQILTKKPVTSSLVERKENPRSRSAKLRVAQKLCPVVQLRKMF